MSEPLKGKVALVTGATSNIGRGVALALAANGARVVVSGRDEGRGKDVVEQIRAAGGEAGFVPAELDGSAAASRALAADAEAVYGRVDVLVNNAGVYPPHTTTDADEETFDRVFGVNVKAPFFLTGALAPGMAARGGGSVINLGSWIVKLALPFSPVYSASKAALEALTRSWAAEFGGQGIRVNAISPGVIIEAPDSPAAAGAGLMSSAPAGRPGTPAEIGAAAVFLAGEESAFVQGAVLDVDGGRSHVLETAR